MVEVVTFQILGIFEQVLVGAKGGVRASILVWDEVTGRLREVWMEVNVVLLRAGQNNPDNCGTPEGWSAIVGCQK